MAKSIQWVGEIQLEDGRLTLTDPIHFGAPELQSEITLRTGLIQVGVETLEEEARTGAVWFALERKKYRIDTELHDAKVCVDTGGIVAYASAARALWVPEHLAKARSGRTFIARDGRHWHCGIHPAPPPIFSGPSFWRFSDPIPELSGLSMNEALEQKLVTENAYAINSDEFSREGAFAARTLNKDSWGWLRADGKVVGIATDSGFGDGLYNLSASGTEAVCLRFIE